MSPDVLYLLAGMLTALGAGTPVVAGLMRYVLKRLRAIIREENAMLKATVAEVKQAQDATNEHLLALNGKTAKSLELGMENKNENARIKAYLEGQTGRPLGSLDREQGA